jgi:Fic family protein
VAPGQLPAHVLETRPWRQTVRGGTNDDRTLSAVTVSLPPFIAKLDVPISGPLHAEMDAALREISVLDSSHSDDLSALGTLLLRTESVASSKIEGVSADMPAYARALSGIRSDRAATSMAAATTALATMIECVEATASITRDALTEAHAVLMADDESERQYAGRFRDMQNWIGGSDHSPRNALYVPPPPDTVVTYMEDLILFANRDDIPVLAQAALAHAQFESIHPFTDGNGRVGRALMNAILRRRRATTRVVVPIASGLVANRERYFGYLSAYRVGDPTPMIAGLAAASRVAAEEARTTAVRLTQMAAGWRAVLGAVRSGSATDQMLTALTSRPFFTADLAIKETKAPQSSVYESIERLHTAGILRPLTERKRNQVWGASGVLDELEDLQVRIAAPRTRYTPPG